MYDVFSFDYDRFVNWPGRLAFELPFIEKQLKGIKGQAGQPIRVLDVATGTGMHTIALAQHGYQASGADLSAGMIAKARQNAVQAGVEVDFNIVGFGDLAQALWDDLPFDALLCLGNSLPHILTQDGLAATLSDFAACLRPGGMLLIQNRNFDNVMLKSQRWMEPQAHQDKDKEWIFVRFYDFRPDGLIDFNILTLFREAGATWQQRITSAQLYPYRQTEIIDALNIAGFKDIHSYGGLNGVAFDPHTSDNLVATAVR